VEHPLLPSSEFDRPPPPNKGEGLVLCLSGGGFRATFFHLGVVRYLAAIDELRRVTDIYAVSGGSILAAHLAQRWDDYKDEKTFNAAADELREFAERDVRGRVVRKWLLGMCFGLPLYCSRFRRDKLLIDEYRKFFGQKQRSTGLAVLKPRFGPDVHLLTTSFTVGQRCEFTAEGLITMDPSRPAIQSARFNLPFALAASSAFPPLFPPVRVDTRRFGIPRDIYRVDFDYMTDGGVYDNLGVRAAMEPFLSSGALYGTDVLVSDASASFRWDTLSSFWSIVGRTTRSIDVMMRRIAELEIESQITRVALAKLAIMKADADRGTGVRGNPVKPAMPRSPVFEGEPVRVPRIRVVRISGSKEDSDTCNPSFEMKTGGFEGTSCKLVGLRFEAKLMPSDKWASAMASIRTDLDRFSQQELQALETWGYEQARSAWPAPPRERADGGRRPPGWKPDPIGEPPTDEQLNKLRRSARRKLRIVSVRDFSGVALLVILTVLGLAVWQIATRWL
jgi:predicted acylesterase/phospholipase RssA